MTIFGYARVSTNRQSLEAQLAELKKAGCKQVFGEGLRQEPRPPGAKARVEGSRQGRRAGHRRLDRLARSSRDLLNVIKEITHSAATFKSLCDTWADTTNAHRRLVRTVLGGLAEFEREMLLLRRSVIDFG
jgi:DNA invertase Pin-like site-specific DNA recombinase